ncbi:thioredoxin family protein [Tenacibaculum xiamenense]|uniref:thioredoxin family protein n=1 Tax=Tenacibaculum xiamenense TaxID=1261553 RepID=UPI00389601CB
MKQLITIILFLVSHHLASQSNDVKLLSYTFEQVEQLQKKKQKPVVVFIHTSWCKFCFAMKEKTFTDPEVVHLLNKNFYFISLDAEFKKPIKYMGYEFKYKKTSASSGIHRLAETLATTAKGISYPTTVILGSGNTIDEQIDYYLSVNQMVNGLSGYLQKSK